MGLGISKSNLKKFNKPDNFNNSNKFNNFKNSNKSIINDEYEFYLYLQERQKSSKYELRNLINHEITNKVNELLKITKPNSVINNDNKEFILIGNELCNMLLSPTQRIKDYFQSSFNNFENLIVTNSKSSKSLKSSIYLACCRYKSRIHYVTFEWNFK